MPSSRFLIASNTLSSSAASVTFSSIPSTYTDLVLKISNRTNAAGTNGSITRMRFNGDTATNYSVIDLYGQGTTAASTISSSTTSFDTTRTGQPSSGNTASTFSSIEVYIPNYGIAANKPISSFSVSENNSATANNIDVEAGLWRNTGTISSIEIYLTSGSFVSDSSFWLYGLKNS